MSIRPYQQEAIERTLQALIEYDRVLCVLATGAGKTVIAGEVCSRLASLGPILFLADAQTLVHQAADKLQHWSGIVPEVEMAESHALPGAQIVVATTQSIARRLAKWSPGYFRLVMVDEAHRNTLGAQSASVLGHFSGAQVIGLTATPYRADRKELGSFYQHISCEIGLVRLIREGWLAPIKIRCVPCNVSLSGVRTSAGDYRDTDLAERLDPHVLEFARILKENAPGRRTVVFTPLIQTAERFAEACRSLGMKAIHASGKDREGVDAFARREVDIIANSALLTTGWDQPDVDCVYVLRPTKSHALYSQMIGRGTRLHPGKDHLLVLDPLFLSEDMSLIRPSRLIAATSEEAESVEKVLESGGDVDLLEAKAKADVDREKSMRKRAEEMAKRKRKEFDAVEFSLAIANDELAGYVPQTEWEQAAPTEGQMDALVNMGFAKDTITCRGFAHRLLEILLRRREDRMATPKQLRWLLRYHYPNARRATFAEASAFLDRKWSGSKADKRKPSATKTAVSLFSEVTNVS